MIHVHEIENAPEYTQQRGALRWGSCPDWENVLFPMSILWQIFARTKKAYLIGYSFCTQKPQKMFIFKSDFIPWLSLWKLNILQVTFAVIYGDSWQMRP